MRSEEHWMHQALALAAKAAASGEVPVGALVVVDNNIIGAAHNLVRAKQDPCAHAEIEAIRQACQHIHHERLPGATLVVTLEPCVMCMGAMHHARISRLIFGTRDFRAGAAGSKWNLADGAKAYGAIQVDEGVCQAPCEALLKTFFETTVRR